VLPLGLQARDTPALIDRLLAGMQPTDRTYHLKKCVTSYHDVCLPLRGATPRTVCVRVGGGGSLLRSTKLRCLPSLSPPLPPRVIDTLRSGRDVHKNAGVYVHGREGREEQECGSMMVLPRSLRDMCVCAPSQVSPGGVGH
jgi:hypothetical protein